MVRQAFGRRAVLHASFAAGLAAACSREADNIAPPEDLMREHGVLNRILLVYEEGARRSDAGSALPLGSLGKGAELIHRFIEQYHERLEEDFLFPLFERANRLVDVVSTLRRQHVAGRALTESIQRAVAQATLDDAGQRRLVAQMRAFIRMYRPHEAREDTVIFPALRSLVSDKQLGELGETFEDKEHQLFGKDGFEGVVREVEAIERELGILDLGQFTPAAT